MKSFYRVIKRWIKVTFRWWRNGQHYEIATIQIDLELTNRESPLSPKEDMWVRLLCHLTCGTKLFDNVEGTKR